MDMPILIIDLDDHIWQAIALCGIILLNFIISRIVMHHYLNTLKSDLEKLLTERDKVIDRYEVKVVERVHAVCDPLMPRMDMLYNRICRR